ncbi:MAG TPA: TRAP transporter small permease subunit [Burkholderiales bacterium]|nr:TRAP transporter small permease subunit [Burkholderiales bacterium]
MDALLKLASWIDALNKNFGRVAACFVLLACLISAGNALTRYAFSASSNAWLEIQWYLFAGIVMFGTAHTLKLNQHVRVDLIYARLSPRAAAWVDLLGLCLFLMPATLLLAWLAWPMFFKSAVAAERSMNPGGLMLWPMQLTLPLGFGLLALQGVSEIVKRAGYLMGRCDMDTHYERPLQ